MTTKNGGRVPYRKLVVLPLLVCFLAPVLDKSWWWLSLLTYAYLLWEVSKASAPLAAIFSVISAMYAMLVLGAPVILLQLLRGHAIPWHYLIFLVYTPIFFAGQRKRKSNSRLRVLYTRYILDPPTMMFIHLVSYLGGRFLTPFISIINDDLVVGSLPLGRDVDFLLQEPHRIGAVINLCDEYPGPVQAYSNAQIAHLHLPTIDMCCPTKESLTKACDFIQEFLDAQAKSDAPRKRVLIHCKGGRGRSVAVAIAYLCRYRGMTMEEAGKLIKQQREVAELSVLQYPDLVEVCYSGKASPKLPGSPVSDQVFSLAESL